MTRQLFYLLAFLQYGDCAVLVPHRRKSPADALVIENDSGPRQWKASDVPSPGKHPEECKVSAAGRLCDPDELLLPWERDQIQDVLTSIRQQTNMSCPDGEVRGYQPGVLLIRKIATKDWVYSKWVSVLKDNEATAERFARTVSNSWKLGDDGCDSSLLLFLSVDDRAFYLKTAAATKKALSDDTAATILNNIQPLLRDDEPREAILTAMIQAKAALQHKPVPVAAHQSWEHIIQTVLLIISFAFFVMFFLPPRIS